MKFIESVKKMLPGCAIALVIAVVAKFLEQLEESVGLHLIGASVHRHVHRHDRESLLRAE